MNTQMNTQRVQHQHWLCHNVLELKLMFPALLEHRPPQEVVAGV